MSRLPTVIASACFAVAGMAAWGTAHFGADWIETRSVEALDQVFAQETLDWIEVYPDGLILNMTGTAPSEAARFRAITLAGTVVGSGRIVDAMDVVDPKSIAPPRFSLEILRNDTGISLIGLVPSDGGRAQLSDGIAALDADVPVTDMVEQTTRAVPDQWADAVDFALRSLQDLPRSKISVSEDRVEITAIADSAKQKAALEAAIARRAPSGITLEMSISAPRPVLTPFTLRFTKDGDAVAFDACSADTDAALDKIVRAAASVGFEGKADCVVGLGVPSVSWADAVSLGIAALDDLGGGTITFSDADVTLIAADTTPQSTFDRIIGQLESDLPEVFSLHSVLPSKPDTDATQAEAPEFVATRSPEGIVQMRGRLSDVAQEAAVLSFARAHFGTEDTYIATRQDPDLPNGWPARVFAGLEALSHLNNGTLIVQPDTVEVRGDTGSRTARADMSRLLSSKLGESADFAVAVVYDELLDPTANIPTPEECVARMNAVLEVKKITFEPGSADIDSSAVQQVEQLAAAFEDCDRIRVEIGGHTDSQGREEMNLNLSQQRADAVRSALVDRGVEPAALQAVGYGESQPIEDNGTEEGREANRRIAFLLIKNPVPVSIPVPVAPPVPTSASATDAEALDDIPETGETADPSQEAAADE